MPAFDPGYLMRGDDAPRRLFVGGVLALLGVTWPLLIGYAVAVMRTTFRGERAPPAIDAWEPIVRDGAIGTAIVLAFALPAAVVAGLAGWPGGGLSTGTGIVLALLVLGSAYTLPAALARFAHRGTLVAGLDAWTTLDVVLLPAYARTWIGVAVPAVLLASAVRIVFSTVTGPGASALVWIVATLVGYAVLVLAARVVGDSYARIMRLEVDASGVARRSSVDVDA
jgi:hypothetical protein